MGINQSIEVKNLSKVTVACITHIGPYIRDANLIDNSCNILTDWAGPKGLLDREDLQFIIVFHDNPKITDENKLRMSVCITIPDETYVEGQIKKMVIESEKYAVARFNGISQELGQAWGWIFGSWFPSSGYIPGDGPRLEIYIEKPKDDRIVIDICIPIKS